MRKNVFHLLLLLTVAALTIALCVGCSDDTTDGKETDTRTESSSESTSESSSESSSESTPETGSASDPESATEDASESAPATETPTETPTEVETTPALGLDSFTEVTIPADSKTFSLTLAQQLLGLCTGNTREGMIARFEKAGFTEVLYGNYDKPDADKSHTSAYSVGKKTMTVNGAERTVLLVAIRGTNAGEWFSNMDFAPSQDNDTAFAENFYLAAQDIYDDLKALLAAETDPIILVSGHSRGAACANLLGLLLNTDRGTRDVYVYTFATPTTVRKTPEVDCSNIFNLINPADPVTATPVASLGFFRAGQDILLPGSETYAAKVEQLAASIGTLADSIHAYYNDKHSLTGAGLSEDGMTTYEVACLLATSFIDSSAGTSGLEPLLAAPAESDFYPFAQTAIKMYTSNDMTVLFMNHMPEVYLQLLVDMAAAEV